MANGANNVLLPSIRTLACSALSRMLLLSHRLDRPWPALGSGVRRVILFMWWSIGRVLGARLRGRMRGDEALVTPRPPDAGSRPDIAPESIRLTLSGAPVVSVINPNNGQVGFTLRCLASIQANRPDVAIEVIVIDDAYPGPEMTSLTGVAGIRLIRNEVNLGFIRACNAAATVARGAFLLFLNNDTEVRPGWLDTMVDAFAKRKDAGIVGSKLLGTDGRLQEAGGILWQDGSAWNFGLGRDPDAPEFNYPREVDYCSGASLLVRRAVFRDVGGFDEKYAPAYCEDSDLSFRLRRRGLKTYYQPRSEVFHFGGASHGRDTRHGVKSCQVTNQATFLETWHTVLTQDHYLNGTHVPRARDRAHGRHIVLIVEHYVPEPDRDAGSRTMITFIRALLASGLVVKFWPFNLYRTPVYTEVLQDMGVEVLYGPHQTSLAGWLKMNGADLDIVLLSRPDVAEMCLKVVRAGTSARIAYYGHDLHFLRLLTRVGLSPDSVERRAAAVMRTVETGIWRDADIVLYPSEEEAEVVRAMAPSADVRSVIPYAFESPDPEHAAGERDRPGDGRPWIVFVAGFGHPPNAEAAHWFAREVMPSIVASVPAARLAIVGSNPPARPSPRCAARMSVFSQM